MRNPEGNVTPAEQENPQYVLTLDVFFTALEDSEARTRCRQIQWAVQEMLADDDATFNSAINQFTYPNTTARMLRCQDGVGDNSHVSRSVGF